MKNIKTMQTQDDLYRLLDDLFLLSIEEPTKKNTQEMNKIKKRLKIDFGVDVDAEN